ncbi:MAG: hypothetical protein P4L73_12235 [Caulobacteraceae bacterium]|nr:hypothetical protein [Caulobacteraceae bacterium]
MNAPGSALLIATLVAAAALAVFTSADARGSRPGQDGARHEWCAAAAAIDSVRQGSCRP